MPKLSEEATPKKEVAKKPTKKPAETVVEKVPEERVETLTATHVQVGSVYVEKSTTKNMGDYNSAKVTIGLTLPFNPTKEDIEEAKKTLSVAIEVVDQELETQVAALLT